MTAETEKVAHGASLNWDVTSIAEAVKQGSLSSREVVETYIEHSQHINPAINAIVEDRYKAAVREAQEQDQEDDWSHKGSLSGIPISVKEAFDVAGMKTTGGIASRKHLIARQDAETVKRLKQAGAIVIGKTNTPMLCFCQETANKLYGRTNNPWDVTRTAGGSSGGEGALLGAGGAAVGLGSDIGGSIRFPSHFNGVTGFKPGKYQVAPHGHFPANAHPLQDRMVGMGPMGKSVRDMELIYQVLANEPVKERSLDDYEVTVLPSSTGLPLAAHTRDTLDNIEQILSPMLPVNRAVPPYFESSAWLWQSIMSIDGGKKMGKLAFNRDMPNVLGAYGKEVLTNNTDIHPYLSWALIAAKLFKPSSSRLNDIKEMLKYGDETLWHYLKDRLLIFPVYHTSAPEHGKVYQEIFSIRKTFLKYMPYVAYANVWGLPSLTIPVTKDENGMPIGVQIISRNDNEDAMFQLGKLLEHHFRGYVRCSRLDK